MPEVAHTLLPRWLGATDEVDLPTDLGVIKAELTSRGINNRGWRLYLDYGDSLFAPLGQHWLGAEHHLTRAANVVAYLRLLQACEMDVLPPIDLVASLLRIPTKLDSDSTGSWTRIPEQAGQSARSDAGCWGFTRVMSSGSSCRAWA